MDAGAHDADPRAGGFVTQKPRKPRLLGRAKVYPLTPFMTSVVVDVRAKDVALIMSPETARDLATIIEHPARSANLARTLREAAQQADDSDAAAAEMP